jgi:EAL domain-containing protein (putative c-di-GMP-specific phosphodiesterase class I)
MMGTRSSPPILRLLWLDGRLPECACDGDHAPLTPVQLPAYTRPTLSRVRSSAAPSEPETCIARALHRRLPERIRGAGTLYLWPRRGRTALRIARKLRAAGREHEFVDACVRVRAGEGEVQLCTGELCSALSEAEAHDVRALFVPGNGAPRLQDFGRITTLHALDILSRSGWLLDQLAEGRFVSYFHPIVHAGNTDRVFAHEALLRGVERDGSIIAPQPILELAREAGLLAEVDSAACRSAIRGAARHGACRCVFINFSPATIRDPEASLSSTLQAIEEAGLPRDQVVFEVTEADRYEDTLRLQQVLNAYRRAGFRVALDDLGAGWSTLNLVHRLLPDFIKLDRELIRGVQDHPVKALIAAKLLEIGRGMGIGTIVEGIEEEGELSWVRDHGADFVQGFLMGEPAPMLRS